MAVAWHIGELYDTHSGTSHIHTLCLFVETLGDPYYKRVPLPRVPEYHNLSQDSQLTKSTDKFAVVEPNIISNYPIGYRKIFGRRRLPITPSFE